MSDLDLDTLKRLAEAATQGQWVTDDNDYDGVFVAHFGCLERICDCDCRWTNAGDNAAFIAAVNPATILAMIAEVRATPHFELAAERMRRLDVATAALDEIREALAAEKAAREKAEASARNTGAEILKAWSEHDAEKAARERAEHQLSEATALMSRLALEQAQAKRYALDRAERAEAEVHLMLSTEPRARIAALEARLKAVLDLVAGYWIGMDNLRAKIERAARGEGEK